MCLLFMVGPWNQAWVYANEVPHGGPLNNFMMGTGHAGKTIHVISGLELWTTWDQPDLPEANMVSNSINHD